MQGKAATNPKPLKNGGYIVGPLFDHIFFIWSPILFLLLGISLDVFGLSTWQVTLPFSPESIHVFPSLVIAFSMAHVFAVFFRSHLNPKIFALHPLRFTLVPLALIGLFLVSDTAWILGLFLIVCADNYHSSLQTFGLGRLYDMRAGNDPTIGRRLDFWLAIVIFMGPILAGATLFDSIVRLERFDEIGLHEIASFPGWAVAHQSWITWPILAAGVAYCVYYLFAYWRLHQQGYVVPFQKVLLYVALAFTSIYTWGFDSFGQAFLIMESFHSFQYFGIVWWSEKGTMQERLHLTSIQGGKWLALFVFLGVTLTFGLWVALFEHTRFELVLFGVCELMHYWYDGFIWSVRKKQVR